jgi:hypothetical protein
MNVKNVTKALISSQVTDCVKIKFKISASEIYFISIIRVDPNGETQKVLEALALTEL